MPEIDINVEDTREIKNKMQQYDLLQEKFKDASE